MNVRKPTDYSAMFAALDELMAENLPQMELYRGIGRVASGRPEKGAAVAAAEYLQGAMKKSKNCRWATISSAPARRTASTAQSARRLIL